MAKQSYRLLSSSLRYYPDIFCAFTNLCTIETNAYKLLAKYLKKLRLSI